MIAGTSTLGSDTDIRDARKLRTESTRENVDVSNRFQGRFAVSRRAENSAVRALSIQSKVAAVALGSEELEFTVGRPLRDVGIEVEKRVDITTVAWEIDHCAAGNRVADRLICGINDRDYGGYFDRLLFACHLEDGIGADDVAAAQDDAGEVGHAHIGRGD